MNTYLIAASLVITASACSIEAPDEVGLGNESSPLATCTRAQTPTRLTSSSAARTYRYTETVRPVTFSQTRRSSATYTSFIAFLEQVNETADVDVFDQRALLERQRDVFLRYLGEEAAALHQAMLDGEVGILTDVTCFQSILFDLQSRDWPLSLGPVEMGAYILERPVSGGTQLRAYVKTQEQGDVTGISLADLDSRVDTDLAAGWQLRAHLHSHPLSPDGPYDIAGTVIPSDADANTYRRLRDEKGLQEAWITNGIHSSRFPDSQFDQL
jgi:hypothetical protein